MTKSAFVSVICVCLFSPITQAEISGVKIGFGHDMGLGVTAQLENFNGFLGNDGLAIDYIVVREKIEASVPLHWYIAAGGFIDWSSYDGNDLGVRAPVGVDINFAPGWDAYVQAIPDLEFVQDFKFGLDGAIGVRYQF